MASFALRPSRVSEPAGDRCDRLAAFLTRDFRDGLAPQRRGPVAPSQPRRRLSPFASGRRPTRGPRRDWPGVSRGPNVVRFRVWPRVSAGGCRSHPRCRRRRCGPSAVEDASQMLSTAHSAFRRVGYRLQRVRYFLCILAHPFLRAAFDRLRRRLAGAAAVCTAVGCCCCWCCSCRSFVPSFPSVSSPLPPPAADSGSEPVGRVGPRDTPSRVEGRVLLVRLGAVCCCCCCC